MLGSSGIQLSTEDRSWESRDSRMQRCHSAPQKRTGDGVTGELSREYMG